jgi:beta-galactosidase
VRLEVAPGLEHLAWYGRGPHENYTDRNTGAAVAHYQSTVTDQYVPYILPQENGNKTDVRWLALRDGAGHGLFAAGCPVMEASALHYGPEDLFAAFHTHELEPRPETILCLDLRQCGLGGASCGPGTLDRYLVKPGEFRFDYRLSPVHPGTNLPELWHRG